MNQLTEHFSDRIVKEMFSIDTAGKCSFSENKNFKIQISDCILALLKLDNTLLSHTATELYSQFPEAVRPYFCVFCSLVKPHIVNNSEEQLLRVINNTAKNGEQVLVPFKHLQYYPVCNRYISSIHTYITDHYNTEPLHFTGTVSCLKCKGSVL